MLIIREDCWSSRVLRVGYRVEIQQTFTANCKYTTRPIVNEYCEGMLKSTLNGGLKALEINWL